MFILKYRGFFGNIYFRLLVYVPSRRLQIYLKCLRTQVNFRQTFYNSIFIYEYFLFVLLNKSLIFAKFAIISFLFMYFFDWTYRNVVFWLINLCNFQNWSLYNFNYFLFRCIGFFSNYCTLFYRNAVC